MIYLGDYEPTIYLGDYEPIIMLGDEQVYPSGPFVGLMITTSIEYEDTGGTLNIRLKSSDSWTIDIDSAATWLTLSQTAGTSGNTTIIATAIANIVSNTRTTTLTAYTTNSAYSGTCVVSQAAYEEGLPNIPFLVNYNARDYDPSTRTIPQTQGQSFAYDLVLNGDADSYTNNSITVNGQYFQVSIPNTNNNPFNRSGSDNQTIIMKVKQGQDTSGAHAILSNRGSNYNWMVFNPANNSPFGMVFLHTSNGAYDQVPNIMMVDTTIPNIFAFKVNSGTGTSYNYTTQTSGNTYNISWGGASNRICFFIGVGTNEIWRGEFCWMYVSNEALTDAQIEQVIRYNESGNCTPVICSAYSHYTVSADSSNTVINDCLYDLSGVIEISDYSHNLSPRTTLSNSNNGTRQYTTTVVLNTTSSATMWDYTFNEMSGLTYLEVDMSSTEYVSNFLYGCPNLQTLVINNCPATGVTMFNGGMANGPTPNLANVIINGSLPGSCDMKLFYEGYGNICSGLTVTSLNNIIVALPTIGASGANVHTCYLGTVNINKLSAAEQQVAIAKGWRLR